MSKFLFLLPLIFYSNYKACCYEVRAWQTLIPGSINVPDYDIPSVASKPNTGISFSGGGSRSYVASLGYLSALHDLDLIDNIRYIVGVSGGSWATAVYSYFQDDTVDDTTLLGAIVDPSEIKFLELQNMDSNCARGFTNVDYFVDMGISSNTNSTESDGINFELWADAVQRIYLDRAGIVQGLPFTFDTTTLELIKGTNPQLSNASFLLLREAGNNIDGRPVPIFGVTLIGPLSMEPFTPDNRNYSILEFTPFTSGVAYTRSIVYNSLFESQEQQSQSMGETNSENIMVGGLIEPFAFGCDNAPSTGLNSEETSGMLKIPDCSPKLDIRLATSASSFYSGCMAASIRVPSLAKFLSGTVDYWAPSAANPVANGAMPYAIGDGGGLQISNMVSLLQRGVSNIVLFCSSSVTLKPASKWNPAVDPLLDADIDFSIPIFFGQIPVDIPYSELRYYEVTQSQVFPSEDWVPLAQQMQLAQDAGSGIVVTSNHKTVENAFYGIPAGVNVTVTWVYLGRASGWEAQLSNEMKQLVIPSNDPENMANTKEDGPFEDFPNYPTTMSNINYERANLLADFAGWIIFNNADQIRRTLLG